jgi:DNA-binding NarL/FixJ family response regulator
MGKEAVKIAIADAQYLARAGFRFLFADSKQITVVGEATDCEELEQLISDEKPQIVILDYHNGDRFQIDDICALYDHFPGLQVLVVTDDQEKANIFRVLDCGVNCILTKNCSPEEIVSAVLATARGEKFFCNKVLEIILEKHHAPGDADEDDCSPSALTVREAEIVGLIAQGITTKDIADQLHLSTHTVYTHRKNIMKKLQINSVSEMILYAVNAGIVKASR